MKADERKSLFLPEWAVVLQTKNETENKNKTRISFIYFNPGRSVLCRKCDMRSSFFSSFIEEKKYPNNNNQTHQTPNTVSSPYLYWMHDKATRYCMHCSQLEKRPTIKRMEKGQMESLAGKIKSPELNKIKLL